MSETNHLSVGRLAAKLAEDHAAAPARNGGPKPAPARGRAGRSKKKTDPPASAEHHVALQITPPNMRLCRVPIVGTAPLVVNAFGGRIKQKLMLAMEAGSQSKKGKKREPKDFQAEYENARHVSKDGWDGIHAAAFRNAMIDACRLVGFKMTHGKLGVFILADGFDREGGVPLVRILGEPHRDDGPVRLSTGVIDIRSRPMWDEGWRAIVSIRFDGDMFSAADVVNLMGRAGAQVGVGEGRACGRESFGIGWGHFEIEKGEIVVTCEGAAGEEGG